MYNKIMVPLDGSELAECVLPHLAAIARGCRISTVVFVRVIDPGLPPDSLPTSDEFGLRKTDLEQLEKHRSTRAEEYLTQLINRLNYNWAQVESEILVGRVAESLADYAVKKDVDLMLVASHGRSGVSRWVMGSVAERIVRNSCCPVLMVRAPGCETRLKGD